MKTLQRKRQILEQYFLSPLIEARSTVCPSVNSEREYHKLPKRSTREKCCFSFFGARSFQYIG